MRVLLVDDDRELTDLLSNFLERQQMRVEVVASAEEALERFSPEQFDVVLLDVMLPEQSGLDVLQKLRRDSQIPIIMLTAKGSEDDRVTGLDLGADDYVSKPFSSRELTARIRALSRRRDSSIQTNMIHHDIELIPNEFAVVVSDKKINLTSVECAILQRLLDSPTEPITRKTLYREVLGREISPFDRSLDTHISNLRRKLGEHGDNKTRIRAIRGVGYILARI